MQQILEISDFDVSAAEYWSRSLRQQQNGEHVPRLLRQSRRIYWPKRDEATKFIHVILWFINKRTGGHCIQRSRNVHVSSSGIRNSRVDPFQRNRLANAEDKWKVH
jgi:hypothetical protein